MEDWCEVKDRLQILVFFYADWLKASAAEPDLGAEPLSVRLSGMQHLELVELSPISINDIFSWSESRQMLMFPGKLCLRTIEYIIHHTSSDVRKQNP